MAASNKFSIHRRFGLFVLCCIFLIVVFWLQDWRASNDSVEGGHDSFKEMDVAFEGDDSQRAELLKKTDDVISLEELLINAFNRRDRSGVVELMEGLSAENLDMVLSLLHRLDLNESFPVEFEAFYRNWAEFDPEAAIRYGMAMETDPRPEWWNLFPEAMIVWASSDVVGAKYFVETLQSKPWNQKAVANAFGLAHASVDSADAMAWSLGLGDKVTRNAAISAIAEVIGTNENIRPEEAVAWFNETSATDFDPKVMALWAINQVEFDPSATAEQLLNGGNETIRRHGLEAMLRGWASYDPTAAGDWINNQVDQKQMDAAIVGYVEGLYLGHPEETLDWLTSVQKTEFKEPMLEKVLDYWHYWNPSEAEGWLQESNLSADFKEKILAGETISQN